MPISIEEMRKNLASGVAVPVSGGSSPEPEDDDAISQRFETRLSPEEEQAFQVWKQQYAPKDSGYDYDLRGAYKAGLKPGANGHWSDQFKKPNHPTFSNESQYAKDMPERAGHWEGETYIPAQPGSIPADAMQQYLAAGAAKPLETATPVAGGEVLSVEEMQRRLQGGNARPYNEIDGYIDEAATRHGVDPRLVRLMAQRESNLNPDAVSPAGAVGVMQLMPGTATDLGVDPRDPRQNIDGGVRYIKQLLTRYGGNVEKALQAYNWGPGNVDKGGELPAETKKYTADILAQYQPQERGGLWETLRHGMETVGNAQAQQQIPDYVGGLKAAVELPVAAAQSLVFDTPKIPPVMGWDIERAFARQGERNLEFLNPDTPAGPMERAFTEIVTGAATEGNAVKRTLAGAATDAGSTLLGNVATLSSDRATADQIANDRAILGQASAEEDKRNLGAVGQVLRPAAQNALSNVAQVTAVGSIGGFTAIAGQFMVNSYDDALRSGEQAGLSGDELLNYARRQAVYEGGIMAAFNALGLPGLEKMPVNVVPSAAKKITQGLVPAIKRAAHAILKEELPEETLTWAIQTADSTMSGVQQPLSVQDYAKQWANLALETALGVTGGHSVDLGKGAAASIRPADYEGAVQSAFRELGGEMGQKVRQQAQAFAQETAKNAADDLLDDDEEQPTGQQAGPQGPSSNDSGPNLTIAGVEPPETPEQPTAPAVITQRPTEALRRMLDSGVIQGPLRDALLAEIARREQAANPAPVVPTNEATNEATNVATKEEISNEQELQGQGRAQEVAPRLDAAGFRAQLEGVAKSKEEADAIYSIVEARAESAGESVDDYIGKRVAGIQRGGTPGPEALAQSAAPVWYSKLREVVEEKMGGAMDANQLRRTLEANGVKPEEMEWSRLGTLQGKITKQQVLDHLDENAVQVQEVVKGAAPQKGRTRAEEWFQQNASPELRARAERIGGISINDLNEAGAPNDIVDGFAKWMQTPNRNTRYDEYQMPGGENYRELLLTLPSRRDADLDAVAKRFFGKPYAALSPNERSYAQSELFNPTTNLDYKSPHFSEPNILAHVRFNDRTDADGKRVLFIEEIQSDWHQKGRRLGYKPADPKAARRAYDTYMMSLADKYQIPYEKGNISNELHKQVEQAISPEELDRLDQLSDDVFNVNTSIPNAPFKSSWPDLAMKRMVRWAAENGYDRVAWTTGAQQADRFDLRKRLKAVAWQESTGELYYWPQNAEDFSAEPAAEGVTRDNLEDYVGKEAAKNILEKNEDESGYRSIYGNDLAVGGDGMQGFYDKILVAAANRIGKKHGAQVGKTSIQSGSASATELAYGTEPRTDVHSLDITPSLKAEATTKGMPLFQSDKGAVDFQADGRAIIHAFESADVSTLAHEVGHIFRRDLSGDDLAVAEEWAGVKDGKWEREHEERFARGFERYLRNGIAPSTKLKAVFERFREWLSNIYAKISGSDIDVKISPEMRQVYDNLLTPRQKAPEKQAQPQMLEPPPSTTAISADDAPIEDFNIDELSLSEDVPNFKEGANKAGVVEPLQGKFVRLGTAPIVVWERTDGRLEVITGRHRLDLARRSGERTIRGQRVREADGFSRAKAMTWDAEANIRDGQGSVRDYATYFREAGLTRAEAEARGLVSRAKGENGWALGIHATDDLYTGYRNGAVNESQAVAIAKAAPDDVFAQRAGMRRVAEEPRISAQDVSNAVHSARVLGSDTATGSQTDMFGMLDDTDFIEQQKKYAAVANQRQREISEQVRILSAAKIDPTKARQMGINISVDDPDSIRQMKEKLSADAARWKEWSQFPDLVKEVKASVGGDQTRMNLNDVEQEQEAAPEQSAPSLDDDLFGGMAGENKKPYNGGKRGKPFKVLEGEPENAKANQQKAQDAINDLEGTLLHKAGGTAIRQVRSFINRLRHITGYVDLTGQNASNPWQVAALAQIWRDERFETFRIIYTDDAGRVLAHEAISSRIPYAAPGGTHNAEGKLDDWFKSVRHRMTRLGASGYWLVHNHPSGDPSPSEADAYITRRYDNEVPGFKGSIVIDTTEFGQVFPDGTATLDDLPANVTVNAQSPLSDDSPKLLHPKQVAAEAAKIKSGEPVLVFTDVKGNVRMIATVAASRFTRKGRRNLEGEVRNVARSVGGGRVFLYLGEGVKLQDLDQSVVVDGFYEGVFMDVITETANEYKAFTDAVGEAAKLRRDLFKTNNKPGFDTYKGEEKKKPRKENVWRVNEDSDTANDYAGSATGAPPTGKPYAQGDDTARPALLEMPELVILAKGLMAGKYPGVVRRIKGKQTALGVFRHALTRFGIELRADIFIGPMLAEKAQRKPFSQVELDQFADEVAEAIWVIPRDQIVVKQERVKNAYVARVYHDDATYAPRVLAHEIGHLIDYLPDLTLARGNMLGRIASLKKHFLDTMPDSPDNPNKPITDEEKAAFYDEVKDTVSEWEEVATVIKEAIPGAEITADDIKAIWNKIGGKDANPKLYDYITKLPESERKKIAKEAMKGIVRDELKGLGATEKTTTVIERKKRNKAEMQRAIMTAFQKRLKEEIERRRLIENAVIRDELERLTMWWNPFDPNKDPDFTQYRFSGKELYADALSVLLNHPLAFEAKAPIFARAWKAYLGTKPEVLRLYESIQAETHAEGLQARRLDDVLAMMDRGERVYKQVHMEQRKTFREHVKDFLHFMERHFVESRAAIPKTGSATNDPRAWSSELQYMSSNLSQFMRDFSKDILDVLGKNGLTEAHLGAYLFLRRAGTERENMANSLGIGGTFADTTLDELKQRVGEEKFRALERLATRYRKLRAEYVFPALEEARLLTPELMDHIRDNENYATFQVQKHINGIFGVNSGAKIFKQLGTLDEITNPVTATVLKDMSLMRAATLNRAKLALVDNLEGMEELQDAERRWVGTHWEYKEPRDRNKKLFLYSVDGKLQGKWLDSEIADLYDRSPAQMWQALKAIEYVGRPYRMSLTEYSPHFGIWNMQRDARAMLKNIPENRPDKVIANYVRTARDAWVDAFRDESTELAKEMYKANLLIPDLGWRGAEHADYDTEAERLALVWANRATNKQEAGLLWQLGAATFGRIRRFNKFLERWSKMAGYSYLVREGYFQREGMQARERIRFDLGSPNFLAGGVERQVINNIFMFANANIQGHRASVRAMREQKGKYLVKVALYDLLPKLAMLAASAGILDWLIGGDEDDGWFKRSMEGMPEHDKMNYTCIPLHVTEEGKTVYVPLPSDHTGQFLGALLWTTLRQITEGVKPSDYANLLATQNPVAPNNLAAPLSLLMDVATVMVGKNPYDPFRGELALNETAVDAGVVEPIKEGMVPPVLTELAAYEWDNYLSTFYRTQKDDPKNVLESISGLPGIGPIVRRLVRVSDAGKDNDQERAIEKAKAKVAIKSYRMGEIIEEYVNKDTSKDSPDSGLAMEAWEKVQKEGMVPEGYQPESFRQRYMSNWIRQHGTREQQLRRRTTNAERVQLEALTP